MKSIRATAVALAVAAALMLGLTLTGCQSSNADIPKGVPRAVEVAQGKVSNEASFSDSNWSFTVEVGNEQAQTEAITKLKGNGFRVIGENKTGESATYALSNEEEMVNATVVLTKRGKRFLVIYNIVQL